MEWYLITGANRGIGLELTKQLLSKGAAVVACCRNPDLALKLQHMLLSHTERLLIYKLDITLEEDISGMREFLKKSGIVLRVLILNAGIAEPFEQIGTFTQKNLIHVLNTNTVGPLLLIQALAENLSQSKPIAKVICISSDLGSISLASDLIFGLSYGISKAALNMGVKKLSSGLLQLGIIVNSIHPSWVQTDLGGKEAPLTSTESVTGILKVIDSLKNETGLFLDYQGRQLKW
jgi:NAD(P)-dependent dehydrogenase (short-subunit alcohol dehydrogenase family)